MDDILCIHHDADAVLQWLHQSLPLKPGSGSQEIYLSTKLHKTRLHNEVWAWAMSPAKYVCWVVKNDKAHLVKNFSDRYRLPKRSDNPFKIGYDPELEISPELKPDAASYFQTNTSIIR